MAELGLRMLGATTACSGWVETPVLDGFGQVYGFDARTGIEIGDGARDAKDPVISAGGQSKPLNGAIEQAMLGIAECAVAFGFAVVEPSIRLAGAIQLSRARGGYAISDDFRRFSREACTQLGVIDSRDFEFQINTIKQWP